MFPKKKLQIILVTEAKLQRDDKKGEFFDSDLYVNYRKNHGTGRREVVISAWERNYRPWCLSCFWSPYSLL